MVHCSGVQYSAVWFSVLLCSAFHRRVRYSDVLCSAVCCTAVQYNIVQCSTVLYIAVQYIAVAAISQMCPLQSPGTDPRSPLAATIYWSGTAPPYNCR